MSLKGSEYAAEIAAVKREIEKRGGEADTGEVLDYLMHPVGQALISSRRAAQDSLAIATKEIKNLKTQRRILLYLLAILLVFCFVIVMGVLK